MCRRLLSSRRVLKIDFMKMRSNRVFKNKHHASAKACGVLQSAAYSFRCERLPKPHNAASRREAQFFNTLLT
jgi:hypothetical protein